MVTHCICHGRSFDELKEIAEELNITEIQGLIDMEFCSCGCKLCVPYIEMMLRSGRTSFHPEEAVDIDQKTK